MKRMKKETSSHYKKRLHKAIDCLVSEWTRRNSKGVCYTCGAIVDWKYEMDAGHYIHNKLDYDPMNRRGQCKRCNKHLSGNLGVFGEKLIKEHGLETIEEMRLRSNMIWKPDIVELEDLLQSWQKEYERITNEPN